MKIGETFIDLHGNQYKILDCHVIGPEYPLFTDNRDAILTNTIGCTQNLIIRGDDQAIIYNPDYKVYWLYEILFISYNDKFDIRKGYRNAKSTKNHRTNCNDGRIPQSKSRNKRG